MAKREWGWVRGAVCAGVDGGIHPFSSLSFTRVSDHLVLVFSSLLRGAHDPHPQRESRAVIKAVNTRPSAKATWILDFRKCLYVLTLTQSDAHTQQPAPKPAAGPKEKTKVEIKDVHPYTWDLGKSHAQSKSPQPSLQLDLPQHSNALPYSHQTLQSKGQWLKKSPQTAFTRGGSLDMHGVQERVLGIVRVGQIVKDGDEKGAV